MGLQPGDQRREDAAVPVWWPPVAEFPLVQGGESSVLAIPSTDWMRPTRNIKCYLLCSRSTGLNVNLIQKPFRRLFEHISGHRGPAKLIQKLNHHNLTVVWKYSKISSLGIGIQGYLKVYFSDLVTKRCPLKFLSCIPRGTIYLLLVSPIPRTHRFY